MRSEVRSSSGRLTRRRFLKTTAAAAGAATFGIPALLRGRNLNSKLNIAAVGAGGKGSGDIDCCSGENIVALCDVDLKHGAEQIRKHPAAKVYQDFRKMFDQMNRSIDAVLVSTPDHTHACIARAAIALEKHVYCQKPLAQTIHEVRRLREFARRHHVITQMGNQGSAADSLRRAVECIQAGLIGPVREVYLWTDRPVWPQGLERPAGQDPVPAGLDWDLWIGPAPMRPFRSGVYHAFNWRAWHDFGTGALGDMACHTVNMPFRALRLGYPNEIAVEAEGTARETYPLASRVRFQFPGRAAEPAPLKGAELLRPGIGPRAIATPPVTLWWFDGGKPGDKPHRHDGSNKPPREITADIEAFQGEVPGNGALLIGDKGRLFAPDSYGTDFFVRLSDERQYRFYRKHPAVDPIPQTLPRSVFDSDVDRRQHLEWIQAIKENRPELCYSRFDLAAELTEVVLLGCIALRLNKTLQWDGPRMRARNAPEAARFVRRDNRPGWES